MKLLLRISLFAVVAILFSSCVKTVETPPRPVANPLEGSWYLYDASEWYGSGDWYPFNAGISGVFSFYNNGSAQYDDGYDLLQGSWYTSEAADGYYDQYGDYHTGYHQRFQTQLSGTGNSSLSLYFDDISFAGYNQFTGTYDNGKSIERYIFKRY